MAPLVVRPTRWESVPFQRQTPSARKLAPPGPASYQGAPADPQRAPADPQRAPADPQRAPADPPPGRVPNRFRSTPGERNGAGLLQGREELVDVEPEIGQQGRAYRVSGPRRLRQPVCARFENVHLELPANGIHSSHSTVAPLAEGGLESGIVLERSVIDVFRSQIRSVGPYDRPKLLIDPQGSEHVRVLQRLEHRPLDRLRQIGDAFPTVVEAHFHPEAIER